MGSIYTGDVCALLGVVGERTTMRRRHEANAFIEIIMTKCKGPHHDLDDFTTYDLTTFTTSRLVIDLETEFTVQK